MNRTLAFTIFSSSITLLVVIIGAGGFGVTAVDAGDDAVAVSFEPGSIEVEPGETVEVDVMLQSEGGHDGEGLYRAELRVDYPAEYVEVADVEVGPWFHQEGETDLWVDGWVDDEAGVARVDQRMQDPGRGVTGSDRIATVTLSVSEDAAPATVELEATESTFIYAVTDFPVPVFGTPAELEVSGGGERVQPDVHEDFDIEESENAELLDVSEESSEPTDDAETDTDTDGSDTDSADIDDSDVTDADATDADADSPEGDDTREDYPVSEGLILLGVGAVMVTLAVALLYARR